MVHQSLIGAKGVTSIVHCTMNLVNKLRCLHQLLVIYSILNNIIDKSPLLLKLI